MHVARLGLVNVVMLVAVDMPGVLDSVGRVTMAVARKGQRGPLAAEHPDADAHDEDSGDDRQVGLDPCRHGPRRPHRRQDRDEHDSDRVGQGDEDAEDEGVGRAAAGPDDVGGGDRLAVARSRRVHGAEPEAAGEVEDGVRHGQRSPRHTAGGVARATDCRLGPAALIYSFFADQYAARLTAVAVKG